MAPLLRKRRHDQKGNQTQGAGIAERRDAEKPDFRIPSRGRPEGTVIGGLLVFAIPVYAMHLKSLLFPDLVFMPPKKIKGQYVFSD